MSNVIPLVRQEELEVRSNHDAVVTIALADILVSHAQLARTIKRLSEHLDALDQITNALSDSDTRARYEQVARKSRESRGNAMLDLSQGAASLPNLRSDPIPYPIKAQLSPSRITVGCVAHSMTM